MFWTLIITNKKIVSALAMSSVIFISLLFISITVQLLPKSTNVFRDPSSVPSTDTSPGDAYTREYLRKRLAIDEFSATKPSWNKSKFDEESPLEPSFLERMYLERPYAERNTDTSQAYFDRSLRFENDYDNPFVFENEQNNQKIRDSKKRIFDDWRRQEINEKSQDIVRGADQDSFPIRILKKTKGLFGGGDLFRKEEAQNTSAKNKASSEEPPTPRIYLREQSTAKTEEEAAIRAKVKSKMNVAKQYGRVVMESNIINTEAKLDLKSQDRVELQAKKSIKLLAIDSGISYGIKNKTTSMNVNKKITDTVDCEVRSLKSNNQEVRSEESVRLNYHINF